MRVVGFLIVLSALTLRTCLAEIVIETSIPQSSGLIEFAVDVLRSCYVNELRTVGLAGSSAGKISERLWIREHIPVILIDNTTRTVNDDPVSQASRFRLQLFVVTASSSIVFVKTLMEVKKSRFWNHMASFLVFDQSRPGCSSAFQVLWAAWEMDLLGVKFMCEHKTKGRLIYTYNPYTSKAPEPWQVEETYNGRNNHIWTLFARKYRKDYGTCAELDFDKTKDLGGYRIRCTIVDKITVLTNFTRNQNGVISLVGIRGKIAQIIFRAMNATPEILEPTPFGSVDITGEPQGGIAEVVNGISDISLDVRYQISFENFTFTRPLLESGLMIITQYRPHASQLQKIASLVDIYSRFGVGLVCLITFVFFVCFFHQTVTSALLNTILIVCNAALLKIPNNLPPRFYLACLFIFVVNIQGIYQGNLASLLSRKVPLKNVNTLRDLVDLNYTIYSSSRYSPDFIDLIPKRNYVVEEDSRNCIRNVPADSGAACIHDKYALLKVAADVKLHLSNEQIVKQYFIWLVRNNWPPENTLNTILTRLVEADLIRLIYEDGTRKTLRRLEMNEQLENDSSIKVLTFGDLSFAFVILGIGLVCATICFIFEMGVRLALSKKMNEQDCTRRYIV